LATANEPRDANGPDRMAMTSLRIVTAIPRCGRRIAGERPRPHRGEPKLREAVAGVLTRPPVFFWSSRQAGREIFWNFSTPGHVLSAAASGRISCPKRQGPSV